MRRFFLIATLVVCQLITPLRGDDSCRNVERAWRGSAADGRQFDPLTGLDTRQYPPDPQVDYTHIKLDLRMPDPSSRSFTCTETITFKTLGRPIDRLRLDAVELQIKSVTDLTGKPLEFRSDEQQLIIRFARELPPRTAGGVMIDYACSDPREGMIFAIPDDAYPDRPLMVHTQGQAETNRYWFAAHDYPNERCTSEIVATIPARYKALANGRLVSKEPEGDGLVRWHYSLGRPHVPYLVSLVIGEFDVVTESWRGLPVEYWVPPGQQAGVARTFGKTPKMMDLYSRLTGADYPYEKYAQSVVYLFSAGGMENTSTTTLHEMSVLDERAALDQDLDELIAHELAHQWFGDMITCKSWAHIWLNEGFATYFASLWLEYDGGRDAYDDDLWHMMRRVAEESGPDPRGGMVFFYYDDAWETFGRRGNNAYTKGASVLHMLRQSLGDELFFRCIAEYVKRHAWQQPESDDLRKVIEELSGRSYERFFQQWVYRSGVPEVKVRYEWDDRAKTAHLTLEQRQEFTFETPAFAADVEVWLVDASGSISRQVVPMQGRSSSGAFACEAEPKQVVIDPNGGVLMKLDLEDVPVSLLVEQAQRGPTSMSRFSAIAALASRDRPVVHHALHEIFLDERSYHGLRSEAAAALGKMQSDPARVLLVAALAEGEAIQHHKVRRAAVTALGEYRHPQAAATLIRFATADPSYAVEASASEALARQDASDEVIEVLLANAEKASYRDQIRSSAVRALAELADERGVQPAMRLARYGQPFRTRPVALEALGKLGRSLNEARRDEIRRFLVPLMHDPQDRSARAAITALGALGDERAVDDLRRFAESGAPDDLRTAARSAIDAIQSRDESSMVRGLRERIEALERDRQQPGRNHVPEDKPSPATAPVGLSGQ